MSKVEMMRAKDKKKGALVPRLRFPEFRDAGEWEKSTVNDLLTESFQIGSKGNKAKKLTVKLWGKGVFKKEETLQGSVNTQYYRRQSGQFIYSKLDFLNQAFGIIPHHLDGFESTVDLPCFDFRSDVNPIFFLEYVKREAFYKKFGEIADGGRKAKRIQVDVFLSFSLLLPPHTKEQQKIADCLSSLDERITAESSKLDTLKDHKKGLLKQLFPAEGETLPQLRFPEFRDAGEWEEKPLLSVADYENGKAYEPHIIECGRYIVVNSRFISTDGAIKKYSNDPICIAKRGDILMVLSDLPNGRALAKSYYVNADDLYAVNQRVCRLTPHSANGKFLCFLLDRHPNLLVFDDGKNQTHLKKNSVLQCLLKLPLSFDEQQRIADCLSSLDELITAQAQKIDLLKTHKKGLMQQLFPVIDEAKA